MRMALAQINPTVGDIAGNVGLILERLEQATSRGAELVVFPELVITGYPPKDLLLKPAFVEEAVAAVDEVAAACTEIAAVVGYPAPSAHVDKGRPLHNAAALCAGGAVVHRHVKSLLPTYDVFDETRYFEPGPKSDVADFAGAKLAITVCEDMWNEPEIFARQLYHEHPIDDLAAAGAQIVVNCSASPFVLDKHAFRMKLMSHAAKRHGMPIVYCNQVGGNDDLVFDGHSCVFDGAGELIAQAKGFEEDLLIVDLPIDTAGTGMARIETPITGLESVYHALVLGLRDYCGKCGFKSIVLGLSGGIDSAVTCALGVGALGPENVRGVTMPSRYSSAGSVSDAELLARNLGVKFDEIPIREAHAAFESMLAGVFAGREPDVTEENIQARCRAVILMAMSNKFGSLLVTTGNKSELAVGYCTLYGDMCGGLALISDVPKTMVYDLARWINESDRSPLHRQFGDVIPVNTITKPPSAELRPDQMDQDSLPAYEVLDEIIERYVVQEQGAKRVIEETGFDAEVVLRMTRLIDRSEYKRKQAAPGIKVTSRAFGTGRRMPIAQRYDPRRAMQLA